jgi:hypothetical protein
VAETENTVFILLPNIINQSHKFLLGLYSLFADTGVPIVCCGLLFYTWWLALAVLVLRMIVQGAVWRNTMKKPNEADLWPYFIFLDIWMLFYYLLFTRHYLKNQQRTGIKASQPLR